MADPGFPVGGGGGANLRRGHFLGKMYAKMKELDPVGGGGARAAAPPRSANDKDLGAHLVAGAMCKRCIADCRTSDEGIQGTAVHKGKKATCGNGTD